MARKRFHVTNGPALDGLTFGHYEGEHDLPAIVDVLNRSMEADGDAFMLTLDDVKAEYGHPVNYDPFEDVLMVEMGGNLVGVASARWKQNPHGLRLYEHHSHLVPEARLPGLRQAMLSWSEGRLREIAAGHSTSDSKKLEIWTKADMNDWRRLVLANGYVDYWHLFEMRRPGLEDIPDLSLPEGIDLRPVTRDGFRRVWEAAREALRDERSYSEERWGEEAYGRLMEITYHRPELWKVAWSGDEVVGAVGVMVNGEENAAFKRKRAWTDPVFVRRPWRRQGIARALLAEALRSARDLGMEEAGLNVDTDNPSGALHIYKQMGFVEAYEFIFARKPLE
jgi:GNAT superfamily N-acetyltransferase